MASIDTAIATSVRRARQARKLTQDQLAEEMRRRGFAFIPNTVYKIETRKRGVSIGETAALADVLGVTINDLIATPASEMSHAAERLATQLTNLSQRLARARAEYDYLIDDVIRVVDEIQEFGSQYPGALHRAGGGSAPSALELRHVLARLQMLSRESEEQEHLLGVSDIIDRLFLASNTHG